MNSLDILIDKDLLDRQYHFLISKYQSDWWFYESEGMAMPQGEVDYWEGIFNLLETILGDRSDQR